MAAGGIGAIRLRANFSPLSGVYVMVGLSLYPPRAERLCAALCSSKGLINHMPDRLKELSTEYWLIAESTSKNTGASPYLIFTRLSNVCDFQESEIAVM